MWGRVIMFLIFLFFIILFNAADFAELYEGVDSFFPMVQGGPCSSRQRPSAVFATFLLMMIIPMVVFDLHGEIMVCFIILFYVMYLLIYILLYFWIKKKKENKENKKK